MKMDKMMMASAGTALVFCLLIAWAFYHTLNMDSSAGYETEAAAPPKAVMAESQELNEARLSDAADKGEVVPGQSMEQVRAAIGDPVRVDTTRLEGQRMTIWWYERAGYSSVIFDENGRVVRH